MKEDISKALDIDGYGASFGYNDDIFLYDSWEASQALNYLVGIEWHASDESGNLILKTLSHKQYSSLDQPEIIDAFFGELQRLHSIWDTGEHSSRNHPMYYIRWAKSKRIAIPWLRYAEENDLFDSTLTAAASKTSLNKRLENNYLRLILSLCYGIPGFNSTDKPNTIAKLIIETTNINIKQETLAKYIDRAQINALSEK